MRCFRSPRLSSPPGLSEQVVQAMLVGVLADGELNPDCVARVAAFAEALGIELPALHTVRVLCEPHMVLFRLDFLRRSHLKNMLVDQYRHHGGIRGAAAALRGFAGNVSGTGARERYVALGDLPLRHARPRLFPPSRDNAFGFPGEPNGFPEGGVYHDLTHVLSGYDTTPQGEQMAGAFTAGASG